MSNTTVNNYASSYVGRELAERSMKSYSRAGTADGRIKTIVDGFDAIIRDSQTSKDEKDLAEFAKGFIGRLSCTPRNDKSISGLFRGLVQGKRNDSSLQVAAGWTFLSAIASTAPAAPGALMAEALKTASSKLEDNSKALCLIENGLDEIQNSTKTSRDEKTLAAFGKKLMRDSSERPYLAGVAGTAFLTAIATLNNGPVLAAITKAINDGADRFGNSPQAVNFMDKAVDGLMNDSLISQDQKSLLAFGRDFSKKLSNSPSLQVAAGKTFLDAAGSSAKSQAVSIMAKAISGAVGQAGYSQKQVELLSDGLSEIIINPTTSQCEKALAASTKQLMSEISENYDVKFAAGASILDEFASGNIGSEVPVLAKAVKAALHKTDSNFAGEVMKSGFDQIYRNSGASEKERALAASARDLSDWLDLLDSAAVYRAGTVLLDAMASGTDKSNVETLVTAAGSTLDLGRYRENIRNNILGIVMKAISTQSRASQSIRTIAMTGAAKERYADKLKAFHEIERIIKEEPGMASEIEQMAEACYGDQRPSQIETVDDNVIIDGVKISRKSLKHLGYELK